MLNWNDITAKKYLDKSVMTGKLEISEIKKISELNLLLLNF